MRESVTCPRCGSYYNAAEIEHECPPEYWEEWALRALFTAMSPICFRANTVHIKEDQRFTIGCFDDSRQYYAGHLCEFSACPLVASARKRLEEVGE